MDNNYEICPTEFSLETISAMTVAYEILKECGRTPLNKSENAKFESNALNLIKTMGLPPLIEKKIDAFIKPIIQNLHLWYHQLSFYCHPILAQQGTVDVVRSTRAIAEDQTMDRMSRFAVACVFCHEDLIYEIGKLLDADEIALIDDESDKLKDCYGQFPVWKRSAKLWLDCYRTEDKGPFKKQLSRRDLPSATCSKGFEIALLRGDEVAAKYFIDEGSPKTTDLIATAKSKGFFSYDKNLSPAFYVLLISRITDEGVVEKRYFYEMLIYVLTNWPYQRFFLEAVRSFMEKYPRIDCCWILTHIIGKVSDRFTDYDYGELFVGVLKLSDDSLYGTDKFKKLVKDVLLSKNVQMIRFLMTKVSDKDKEGMLMDLDRASFCEQAIKKKDFCLFKLCVRGLGSHSKDLMVRFRDLFDAHYSYYYTTGVLDERNVELRMFLEIVDKIMAEMDVTI